MENNDSLWGLIIKNAINLPFVKVDRTSFLKKELLVYCTEEEVTIGIDESPLKVLDKTQINKLANGCIKYHLVRVCGTSALAGIPGGWWATGTIPLDIAQFYGHIFALTQKLLYIYGWPDLRNGEREMDDETIHLLTIFTGVMLGNKTAIEITTKLAKQLAQETSKRLVRMPLTKYSSYILLRQILKWFGVKLTKDSFAKSAGKIIPLIGAPISGMLTYSTFKPMAKKFKKHLDEQFEILNSKYKTAQKINID